MSLVSDIARLAAFQRAREAVRPDAVFRDRFARPLAGEPDAAMAHALAASEKAAWFYTARTYAFDRLLLRELANGADLVVQLAAGLDARPYRLELPPALRWVELDLAAVLDHKADLLADAKPACRVDRIDVDLSNPDARRGTLADLGRRASRAIVIAEGLLVHLMGSEVDALARDVAMPPTIDRWIVDVPGPGLVDLLAETSGELMRQAGAPYVFAPYEGPAFFRETGWQVMSVRSVLKTAAKLERLPLALRLMAMLPERAASGDRSRPWAGVCLLGKPPVEAGAPAVDGSR